MVAPIVVACIPSSSIMISSNTSVSRTSMHIRNSRIKPMSYFCQDRLGFNTRYPVYQAIPIQSQEPTCGAKDHVPSLRVATKPDLLR
ncbi:hypothetical protein V6N13_093263 [Hibiscus sabdariffa]